MNPLSNLVFFVAALTVVFGAPAGNASDSGLIHQNALDAQVLNGQFQTMKETDPCNSGQTACIEGAPAQCKSGSWQVGRCLQEKSCFALPKPNARGTFLSCVSTDDADSLFEQAGVNDGPISNSTSSSIVLPTASPTATGRQNSNDSGAANSVITVTVTVPAPSISTSTFVATVDPVQALGVIQSALANGAVVVSSSPTPSAQSSSAQGNRSSGESRTRDCTATDDSPMASRATQAPDGTTFEFKRSRHTRRVPRH